MGCCHADMFLHLYHRLKDYRSFQEAGHQLHLKMTRRCVELIPTMQESGRPQKTKKFLVPVWTNIDEFKLYVIFLLWPIM